MRLLFFITWLVELPFLSLQAQSPGGVTRTADGDSTMAANQSMRVVTFKAVPETERLFILANSIMELIKKTALLNISYQ